MNTTLLIMAASIGSRFGIGIKQVVGDRIASICSSRRCWRMACTRLIYLQTCDILGAVAPCAARNNHTPLRGEQQATILWSAKM